MAKKEYYNIDLSEGGKVTKKGSSSHSASSNGRAKSKNTKSRSKSSHASSGRSNSRSLDARADVPNRNTSGKKKLTRSQKRRKRRKILFIIEMIVLLLLLAGLFVWLKFGLISWDDLKNLQTNDLDEETQDLLSDYTTIALFGVDNRSMGNYESGNSDSIMICSINNETKEVKLVSVYRDTCLDVDGDETFRKCNYAYNHGGAQEAIEMLNRNLDLNIQKYVSVDFYALAEAVDALGGITLDITSEEASYMNGVGGYIALTSEITGRKGGDVSVGTQTVNGVQAVAYCRIRYTAGGDFARAERQRIVLQQMEAALEGANISELNELIDNVFDDIGTNFTLTQIVTMAASMSDYDLVSTSGFPYNKKTFDGGSAGSLVVPCTLLSNVEQLHKELFGNEEFEPSTELQNISDDIINYTGYTEDDALDYGY